MMNYNPKDPMIDRAVLLLDPANPKSYNTAENLLLYSEQFDNAAWSKISASVTANNTTAPDGTLTADLLVATATGGARATQAANATADGYVTFSVYLKAGNATTAEVALYNNTTSTILAGANISISGVSYTQTNGGTTTVTSVGSGWVRATLTSSIPIAAGNNINTYVYIRTTNATTGDTVYAWGAQLIMGTIPKTYLRTTSASTAMSTSWIDIAKGYNGTMVGTVQWSNDAGGAWDFGLNSGGQGNLATLGFSMTASPIPQMGNFVIAAWVKNPSTISNNSQPAILYNAGGGNGYRFGAYSGGIYALGGFPYTEGVSTAAFTTGVWYHICVVYDRTGIDTGSARMAFYLNATAIGYMNLSMPQTQMSNAVPGIVKNAYGGGTYNGKLGMLTAYNGHATPAEVQLLFASQCGRYGV
jgi:hypothetical protein